MELGNDEKIEMKPKTLNINVNGMPEKIFADWNQSCIENYGDSRWVKMFSDHQKAKQFDEMLNLYSKAITEMDQLKEAIEQLFKEIESLKQSRNESGVQTLGGYAKN
jgi:thymidylate synthase